MSDDPQHLPAGGSLEGFSFITPNRCLGGVSEYYPKVNLLSIANGYYFCDNIKINNIAQRKGQLKAFFSGFRGGLHRGYWIAKGEGVEFAKGY